MFLADTTSATSCNAGDACAGGLQRKGEKKKVNFWQGEKKNNPALPQGGCVVSSQPEEE